MRTAEITTELASYYHELERQLQCPRAKRKEFLRETQRLADDYIENHPHAEFSDVAAFMGRPEDVARSYHELLGPEVTRKYCRSKRIKQIIMIAIAAALLISAILYNIYLQNRQYDVDITEETVIVIYKNGEGEN